MKKIAIILFLIFSGSSYSIDFNEYSKQQESVTRLENQIKILELKKKIVSLNNDINDFSLITKDDKYLKGSYSKATTYKNFKSPTLLYLSNNGINKYFTFKYDSEIFTLSPGDQYRGWTFNIKGSNISFIKDDVIINGK